MEMTTSSPVLDPDTSAGLASPADHSPEFRLLQLCARCQLDEEMAGELRALIDAGLDWKVVLEAAHWHSLMPLLHEHLTAIVPGSLPPVITEALQSAHDQNARRTQDLSAELFDVLREFRAAGLSALPFKGPALAGIAYDSITSRHFTNLDILVALDDVPQARELLLARGYRRVATSDSVPDDAWLHLESRLSFSHATTGIPLDLHCQIVPRRYCYRVRFEELLGKARVWRHEAGSGLVLSSESCLIVLGLHAIKNGFWPSLKQVCDVAEVIKADDDIDWRAVIDESIRLQCDRAVLLGLLLAHQLLGASIPPEVLAEIRSDHVITELAAQVEARLEQRQRGFATLMDATRVHLRLRTGVWSKARYLFCIITTPSERDFQFMGKKISLRQSYPIRMVKFAQKFVRQVSRAVFRK